mgnify:CR=1 FL=1
MPEISLTVLFFLFLGGLAAGFVDSIAGGGGLISMPVLLSVGLPPHFALGTNKLQSSFGSLMASINYYRGGLVNLKRLWMGLLFTAIGAAAGSFSVQYVSQKLLQILIPILLIVVFLVVLVFKKLGESDRQPVMAASLFYMIFGLLIGFYDGFFGPGTGNFWVLGFIFLLGGGVLIGLPAVALSVIAVLIGLWSWSSARRDVTPAMSMALLDVLLPWLLGMFSVGLACADIPSRWQPLLVALGFTVFHWGTLHAVTGRAGQRSLAVWIGIVVVLAVLVALRMPWAAAVVAVLLAPVAYGYYAGEVQGSVTAYGGPWALISLLVAALALR